MEALLILAVVAVVALVGAAAELVGADSRDQTEIASNTLGVR
jgi:hypothetical protein